MRLIYFNKTHFKVIYRNIYDYFTKVYTINCNGQNDFSNDTINLHHLHITNGVRMSNLTSTDLTPTFNKLIDLQDPAQISLMSKLLNCSFDTMIDAVRNSDGTLLGVKKWLKYKSCKRQNCKSAYEMSY